tara:strand:- start:170 stop:541 length:372 start_codon:yes stop_codon:yes gene_type:complete
MAFKLGSKRGNTEMKLSIGGANHHVVGGVRVEFKELPEGIKGECHKEGVIYISDDIQKNSEEYNRVLAHEMKHMTHYKTGRVDYDDETLTWDGVEYPREDGYILYEGQWMEEGDPELPWEFKD